MTTLTIGDEKRGKRREFSKPEGPPYIERLDFEDELSVSYRLHRSAAVERLPVKLHSRRPAPMRWLLRPETKEEMLEIARCVAEPLVDNF